MARTGRPPKHKKISRSCETCGKKWKQYPYELSRSRFCSRKCWAIGRRGEKRGTYAKREEKKCEHCGGGFFVGGQGNPKRSTRYCCLKCSASSRYVGKDGHGFPRAMSPTEAAWFAGIFDGEGCIAWPRRSRLHSVRLSVANTSLPLLKKLKEISGTGAIREKRGGGNPKHSRAWTWDCYAANSLEILKQISSWLIVKRIAAEIALGITEATEPPQALRTLTTLAALKENKL